MKVPPWGLPNSGVRVVWDALLLCLASITFILTPVRVAVVDLECGSHSNSLMYGLNAGEFFADLIFVIDLVLCLQCFARVARVDNSEVVISDRAAIFSRFIRSSDFVYGVLACVPFVADASAGWTFSAGMAGNCSSTQSLLGLFRLFRMSFTGRLFRSFKYFFESRGVLVNASQFRMAILMYLFSVGLSASGCAYFAIACPPNTSYCLDAWLGKGVANQRLSWAIVDTQMSQGWSAQVVRSVYFAMQTLFTIGYGDDVAPVSPREMCAACFFMFVGQFAYAATIANMTSLMANADVLNMRFKQEMDTLDTYMDYKALPQGLRLRVRDFFGYLYQKQYGMLDEAVWRGIAPQFKIEILHQRALMLHRIPFFSPRFRSENFIMAAAKELLPRTYTPHSVIRYGQEKQSEMIILVTGTADVCVGTQSISTLLPGDFIGDFNMIVGEINTVSVWSRSSFVDVLVLQHGRLQHALAQCGCSEAQLSQGDPGVQSTVSEHALRDERFSKLRATMKNTQKNKKVIGMMEEAPQYHDKFIIPPSSEFHLYWDILKLLALLFLCIMSPLHILTQCTHRPDHEARCSLLRDFSRDWRPGFIADYCVDAFFLVDMGLNYRCFAFNNIEDGRNILNTSPDAIKERYLRSRRFQLDFLGSFPLDLFLCPMLGGYFSLFRLAHATRVSLLRSYVSELQRHLAEGRTATLSSGGASLLTIAFCVVVTFHFISVSWALLHFRGATSSLYWESLYWAVTTFTTVGYGDIVPEDPLETTVAIIFGVGGALFAAAVIANVTAYSHSMDSTESNLGHQKQCFKRYFGTREIDSRVQEKVMAYYQFLENTSHGADEAKFLGESLPWNLKDDFSLYTTHKLVLGAPIFNACKADFLKAVMRILNRRYYVAQEWLVADGDITPGMFFQGRGHTELIHPSTGVCNILSQGGSFGAETLLLQNDLHQTGLLQWARALTESELWLLDPIEFRNTALMFPGSTQTLHHKVYAEPPSTEHHQIKGTTANGQRRSSFYSRMQFSSAGRRDDEAPSGDAAFTVRPDDPRLGMWRAVILICTAFNTFVVTYRTAFSRGEHLGSHLILDYITEVLFLLDVLLRATALGFVVDDELICTRQAITENYLKNDQMVVDIFSAFPLELFVLFPTASCCWLQRPQLFAALRANKLLRVTAIPELSAAVERAALVHGIRLGKNALRLAKLECIVFFASHIFGCGFFLIALIEHKHGQCNNWAGEAGILTDCVEGAATCAPSFDAADAYIQALYWAVATLTTVGYGDIHAARGSSVEAFYCTIVLLLGTFAVYALVMSNLAEIVSQLDVSRSIFTTRADHIRQVCSRRAIPDHLSMKVRSSLDSLWTRQRGIAGTALLGYLPTSLHAELVNERIGQHLRKLFYVQLRPHAAGLVDLLAVTMLLEHFETDDVLFHRGEPAVFLHIIDTGAVRLLEEVSGTVFATVNSGTISEGEFFMRQVQPCSAIVECTSDVFEITFDAFWSVLTQRGLTDDFLSHIQTDDCALLLKDASTSSTIEKVSCNLKSKKMAQRKSKEDDSILGPRYKHVIAPSSLMYRGWKIAAFFFVVYISALTPFWIAFGGDSEANHIVHLTPLLSTWILTLDSISTFFFACDWALHLTVFMCRHDGRLITNPVDFRKVYARGNMALDSLSIMPLFLFSYPPINGPLGRQYAFLRLFQLTRVARIKNYFDVLAAAVAEMTKLTISSTGTRRLVEWALFMVLVSHWGACAFYFLSRSSGQDTWASQAAGACKGDLAAYVTYEVGCTAGEHYLVAFYWSLYTLTTTGYGSVPLSTSNERIFAMFAMVLGGAICDSGVTSLLASLFGEKDRVSATNKRKIECTTKYLQNSNFGAPTRQRVRAYFKYVDEELGGLLDSEVLSLLPSARERDVATYFCYQSLREAQLFEKFTPGILHHLVRYMKPYLAIPGEVLRGKGSPLQILFVVVNGRILCTDGSGKQSASRVLPPGSLIIDTRQLNPEVATAHAHTHLYKLDLTLFDKTKLFFDQQTIGIVDRYPVQRTDVRADITHTSHVRGKLVDAVQQKSNRVSCDSRSAPPYDRSNLHLNNSAEETGAENHKAIIDTNREVPVSALEALGPFMEDTFYRSYVRRRGEDKKEVAPRQKLLWGRRVTPDPQVARGAVRSKC